MKWIGQNDDVTLYYYSSSGMTNIDFKLLLNLIKSMHKPNKYEH